MAATTTTPVGFALTITEEERAELVRLLEQTLGDTRVEAHRTHTPDYRQGVLQQEELVRGMIRKLRRA